jgi:6-pyruvoyltetrahydropterin/6-carboxytetrahydropterin synthase
MFQVAVQRDFIAQHFLIGGDWGAENFPHSHHYVIELVLSGQELDQHGYLVDIVEIEAKLERQLETYRDKLLNELPEFSGINPSLERFTRILCEALSGEISAANVRRVKVQLWENEQAWASFELER